jgi:hypothetical protein
MERLYIHYAGNKPSVLWKEKATSKLLNKWVLYYRIEEEEEEEEEKGSAFD